VLLLQAIGVLVCTNTGVLKGSDCVQVCGKRWSYSFPWKGVVANHRHCKVLDSAQQSQPQPKKKLTKSHNCKQLGVTRDIYYWRWQTHWVGKKVTFSAYFYLLAWLTPSANIICLFRLGFLLPFLKHASAFWQEFKHNRKSIGFTCIPNSLSIWHAVLDW